MVASVYDDYTRPERNLRELDSTRDAESDDPEEERMGGAYPRIPSDRDTCFMLVYPRRCED